MPISLDAAQAAFVAKQQNQAQYGDLDPLALIEQFNALQQQGTRLRVQAVALIDRVLAQQETLPEDKRFDADSITRLTTARATIQDEIDNPLAL